MDFSYTSTSLPLFFMVLSLLSIVPVKLGAELFSAPNRSLKHCAIGVVLGAIASLLILFLFGDGFFSLTLMFASICLSYWFVLKLSLASSFGFALFAIFLQLTMAKLLNDFGVLN